MKTNRAGADDRQATLIASLLKNDPYPHPVDAIELVETHISWVLLTGRYAYKLKKALKLAFLDFSTLELRRHFCEEELRLNRRWAPEIYLDVVPVCGKPTAPRVGGDGEPIEYAVKMLQFARDAQLDRLLDAGELGPADMLELAEAIAAYHAGAPVLDFRGEADAVAHVREPMLDNFAPLETLVPGQQLARLREWTENSLAALETDLVARRREGFVRDCHGDLHLSNLVRLSRGIAAFDCVEFGTELRNIDVLSDISFLVMDLVVREHEELAYILLNRYLECTGDYAGLSVFGLYLVYHCLIRAKIAAIRHAERATGEEGAIDLAEIRRHVEVAFGWINRPPPLLVAMHGYSGSGKTWLSDRLLPLLPAVRLRSDIERKRLHGLAETADSESALGQGLYSERSSREVYARLMALVGVALQAGYTVIVDAAFLARAERRLLPEAARQGSVPFRIVETSASGEELRRRLGRRNKESSDVSEADTRVLEYQAETAEPLDAEERRCAVRVATDRDVDPLEVVRRLRGTPG